VQYILDGFKITNTGTGTMAYDWTVSMTGPGVLSECAGPNAITGTTPVLNPGQSHEPNDACIDFGAITEPDTVKVTYIVTPVNNDCWADTCCTYIIIEPPVPVAFQSFDVFGSDAGIELGWYVIDAVDVTGYNVYRSEDRVTYHKLNERGLLGKDVRSYVDTDVRPGKEYTYRIGAMDREGEILSLPRSASMKIATARLDQNWPNPFNPSTSITFVLPADQLVQLHVYDARGRLVKRLLDGKVSAGETNITWDGTDARGAHVGSGVYYYRLSSDGFTETRKMVLLK
jgi:hypothetical protein